MSYPKFDLLSLPLVPLRRILLNFDHHLFLDFSLCSTTTRDLSRSVAWYRKPVKLEVVFSKLPPNMITVCYGNESEPGIRILIREIDWIIYLKTEQILNIAERHIEYENFSSVFVEHNGVRHLSTFCSDPFIGTMKIAEYIADLYNHPIDYVKMETPLGGSFSITQLQALDDFFWLQPVKKVFFYHDLQLPQSQFVYIMNRLKCAEVLIVRCTCWRNHYENISIDLKGSVLKEFITMSARWLTLQNILDGQFEKLSVYDTKLTNEDVNTIIKKWLRGWNRNMRHMEIHANQLDVGRLLTGIPAVLKSDENTRIFYNETVKGGWEIKRDNEDICRITIDDETINMFIWPSSENV